MVITVPDGNRWQKMVVSAGGHFLGTVVEPDFTNISNADQLGFTLIRIAL